MFEKLNGQHATNQYARCSVYLLRTRGEKGGLALIAETFKQRKKKVHSYQIYLIDYVTGSIVQENSTFVFIHE